MSSTNSAMANKDSVDVTSTSQEDSNNTTTSPANTWKKAHHRRTSSLLPTLNSLGSFLASAGGLTGSNSNAKGSSTIPSSSSGGLSTDAELMISHPTPTEWADDSTSPLKSRFGSTCSASRASRSTESQSRPSPRNLSEQVRFRGQPKRAADRTDLSNSQSFIAFPSPTSPTMPTASGSERPMRRSSGSRTSSAASTARDSDSAAARLVYSPEPSASTTSSSADTPATSVRYSPASTPKTLPDQAPLQSPSPPPPSETTIKADPQSQQASSSRTVQAYQTLPRSFAASTAKRSSKEASDRGSLYGRTTSLSAATGRRATDKLNAALESDEKTTNRQAGFRARSINSIRGLAAAWVPARFAPTSQPSSSASSSSSNDDDSSSLDPYSPRRRDGMALTTTAGTESKTIVRHGTDTVKRPVKLDRRRLDKAVSLAVEAAQAAEEDERLWEEKRAKKAAQGTKPRPALQDAWTSSSRSSNKDSRQLARYGASGNQAEISLTSEEEDEEEDDDDLGFSLDLYISSLGYLISAISDKEAPGLSSKQKQDIKQRLEEGMSKLGFDAKAELEKAEAMKRELELEREKLQLQQQHSASPTANVIHHHYHTAVPANGYFGMNEGNFSRAHAAAKASSRGSSSLAGKISSSVLDIGLHIGAGALSALSANLSAIAPRGVGTRKASGSSSKSGDEMEDPRITDLDNDEDLQSMPGNGAASPRPSPSQPGIGAATPRTAWTRSINQNNKQWELAVAFTSTAASALASSLGAVARNEPPSSPSVSPAVTTTGPLTQEQQQQLAQYGYLPPPLQNTPGETAEDRLILLSASLARSLKRSPLPTQLYQLLRQLVSILAAIDAKYSLTEKGTQLAVRETSRAMRFVRRHDLHVKAVRVAWAAAEAAVAALEAYRDEKGWMEQQRIAGGEGTPVYGGSPPKEARAIEARQTVESKIDDAEAQILAAAEKGKERQKVGQRA